MSYLHENIQSRRPDRALRIKTSTHAWVYEFAVEALGRAPSMDDLHVVRAVCGPITCLFVRAAFVIETYEEEFIGWLLDELPFKGGDKTGGRERERGVDDLEEIIQSGHLGLMNVCLRRNALQDGKISAELFKVILESVESYCPGDEQQDVVGRARAALDAHENTTVNA
jgi:hypothetical protein